MSEERELQANMAMDKCLYHNQYDCPYAKHKKSQLMNNNNIISACNEQGNVEQDKSMKKIQEDEVEDDVDFVKKPQRCEHEKVNIIQDRENSTTDQNLKTKIQDKLNNNDVITTQAFDAIIVEANVKQQQQFQEQIKELQRQVQAKTEMTTQLTEQVISLEVEKFRSNHDKLECGVLQKKVRQLEAIDESKAKIIDWLAEEKCDVEKQI